jgi:hypothetical protein
MGGTQAMSCEGVLMRCCSSSDRILVVVWLLLKRKDAAGKSASK